jgi:SAM-dependent methyltransferase
MSSSNLKSEGAKFTAQGVSDYERSRYRGFDQRIVHAREVRLIDKMFERIRQEEGERQDRWILDMPCGYGRFAELLAGGERRPAQGCKVISGDLSFEMVRRAAEKTGTQGVVADAKLGVPFKAGAFDLVFSIRFFHHVHDAGEREAVLCDFFRVTSRWAIVSFYRMSGLHTFQRRIRRLFGKSRTNIKMIKAGNFEREAEAAGFETVSVLPLFRGIHAYHLALLKKIRI